MSVAVPAEQYRASRADLRSRRLPSFENVLLALAGGLFSILIALPLAAIFMRALPTGLLGEAVARPVVLDALRLSFFTTLEPAAANLW